MAVDNPAASTQYVQWSPSARGSPLNVLSRGIFGDAGEPDAFYTDDTCRTMFKAHITKMATRRSVACQH